MDFDSTLLVSGKSQDNLIGKNSFDNFSYSLDSNRSDASKSHPRIPSRKAPSAPQSNNLSSDIVNESEKRSSDEIYSIPTVHRFGPSDDQMFQNSNSLSRNNRIDLEPIVYMNTLKIERNLSKKLRPIEGNPSSTFKKSINSNHPDKDSFGAKTISTSKVGSMRAMFESINV